MNTEGSFMCGCEVGYQLNLDGVTCSGGRGRRLMTKKKYGVVYLGRAVVNPKVTILINFS